MHTAPSFLLTKHFLGAFSRTQRFLPEGVNQQRREEKQLRVEEMEEEISKSEYGISVEAANIKLR